MVLVMRKIGVIIAVMFALSVSAQNGDTKQSAFKAGEWFKFRVHYGIFNACYATLHVKNDKINGKPVYRVTGKGRTTGLARALFKVDDLYESYVDKKTGRPYKFVRNIYEGGYTKDTEINFDYTKKKAVLKDKKNKKEKDFKIKGGIQDLISAFYYLRNNYDLSNMKVGKSVSLDMLFDEDGVFTFKLKYLGKDTLKTKFGKVACLKFRPYVQAGHVFKEQESLTLWVSNDDNKIPIRIKADIQVGSIKADLDAFNGLKHQFKIIMN